MRISKVESQMKILTTLHATDEEDVKLSQGRHVSVLIFSVTLSSENKTTHRRNPMKLSTHCLEPSKNDLKTNKLVTGAWPMHRGC